jgi:hypothetical protein
VIETVAFVVGKQKEEFLEKELQVAYGFLVWEIYRHSLMHGDELRYVVYKDKTISWAAHLGNENIGHIVVNHTDTYPTTIHIAIPKLYYTLQDFLKKEIEKNDTSIINIQVGVNYPDNKSKVINQLDEIIKKY